jgi:hypothetical protein
MKRNLLYSSLILTLALPLLWKLVPQTQGQWHPFSDVIYRADWYWTLFYLYVKPVLYLIACLNYKKERIVKVYLVYEIILFMDFLLTYSQSEFRVIVGILLGIYTFYEWAQRRT